MYYKRCTGEILVRKSDDSPGWVRWTHYAEGKTHCEECLMLDGCWFREDLAPPCPHYPSCHCTLDPIDAAVVRVCATAYSYYSKYDPYLFNSDVPSPPRINSRSSSSTSALPRAAASAADTPA